MKTKNKGLHVRVDDELRRDFVDACRSEDQHASQVIRAFMREYVQRHQRAVQKPLFPDMEVSKAPL